MNGRAAAQPDLENHYRVMWKAALAHIAAEVVYLTPELAAAYLATNDSNRPIDSARVRRYVRAIKAGEWDVTGETIIFTRYGRMIQGQHRCQAVIDAGVAVPVVVLRGVDDHVFFTLDQGKPRSVADALSLKGTQNAKYSAAALGWLWRLQKAGSPAYQGPMPQNQELVAFAEGHPRLADSVIFVRPRAKKGLHSVGQLAFLHYVCSARRPDLADTFFNSFMTADRLDPGTPEWVLNQTIAARHKRNDRQSGVEFLAICVKAWNAYVRGQRPRMLKWNIREGFPEIA